MAAAAARLRRREPPLAAAAERLMQPRTPPDRRGAFEFRHSWSGAWNLAHLIGEVVEPVAEALVGEAP